MPNLFKAYLRRCWQRLVLVVILVLAQPVGNLYLPSLNVDISNNGVVTGSTHYSGCRLPVTSLPAIAAMIAVYRIP